jgi:hypothetical protein
VLLIRGRYRTRRSKTVVWTNTKEIPGNGIDDDKTHYVDDIHGWNFLEILPKENLRENYQGQKRW